MMAGMFTIPKSPQSYVRTMYFIVFFVIFGLSEDKSIKDDDGIFSNLGKCRIDHKTVIMIGQVVAADLPFGTSTSTYD